LEIDMPNDTADTGDSTPAFLKSIFGAGGLLTAWVFVLGWAYLYTYYEYFGLNLNSLGFPVYHYLLFCFAQFVSFRWRGLLVGLMVLVVFLLTWEGMAVRRKIWATLVAAAYLALFWIGFHFAVTDGAGRAVEDMGQKSYLPLISLEFKSPGQQFKYGAIEQTLASDELRLLLENGDRLFVFVPVNTEMPIARVSLVEVDRRDVFVSMRTVRILTK
jgi:hypothetical protein